MAKAIEAEKQAAREARNAYKREWYKKNREKSKAYQEKYWAKKALEASGE